MKSKSNYEREIHIKGTLTPSGLRMKGLQKPKSKNGRERVNHIEGFGVVLYIYSNRSVWFKTLQIIEQ